MTKKEILELESANSDSIHLFLEGTFWIAYEKSAFRFVRSVRPYRVRKKFIKNIGTEMVSLGFPMAVLDEIASVPALEVISRSEKQAAIKVSGAFDPEEFEQWKSGIPLLPPDTGHAGNDTAKPEIAGDAVPPIPSVTEIICRLRGFDLGNKTPLECMFFVSELKRMASPNAI